MKKKLLLLLPIISVLSSCSNNMFMNQEDETVNLNTKPTTWQEQLEYAKNSLNTRATTDYNVRQNLDSCLRCKKSIKFTPLKQLSHEKKDFCRN